MTTKKSKHTPGPWIVKTIKDGYHDGKAFIFGPQLDKSEYRPAPVVLLIEKPCKDKDEHAANLALCAAAPELLAALERIVALAGWQDFWAGDRPGIKADLDVKYISALDGARAAIAKAKGE